MVSWVSQIRRAGVLSVASKLGMTRKNSHIGPCPACNEHARSETDSRFGPIYLIGPIGWKCNRCGVGGDSVVLAQYVLCGARLPKGGNWADFRRIAGERGLCSPDNKTWFAPLPYMEPVVVRLDGAVVREIWDSCSAADSDLGVYQWLQSRGLDAHETSRLDIVRALPADYTHELTRLGMSQWCNRHRCIFPVYDQFGNLVNLRARDITSSSKYKSVSLAGGEGTAKQCCMQNEQAHEMFTSGYKPNKLIVCEGEPDYATRATESIRTGNAVIGIWNGCWTPKMAERVPRYTTVVIRTHSDVAGRRYMMNVARSLWDRCDVYGISDLSS